MTFVQACRLMCQRYIYRSQVARMQQLFDKFVQTFERRYGESESVPNIHNCYHQEELTLDFGPPSQWWSYAPERLNALLESMNTNGLDVEVTMFKTGRERLHVESAARRVSFGSTERSLLQEISSSRTAYKMSPNLLQPRFSAEELLRHRERTEESTPCKGDEPIPGALQLPFHTRTLPRTEYEILTDIIKESFPGTTGLSPDVEVCSRLILMEDCYGSADTETKGYSRSVRSSFIYSRFTDSEGMLVYRTACMLGSQSCTHFTVMHMSLQPILQA
jgi:hypothetical protein